MKNLETKPDVALEVGSEIKSQIRWVGMSEVELPVLIKNGFEHPTRIFTKADLFVSLDDPNAKGIHMSRLYLKSKEFFADKNMSFNSLEELSEIFIESHKDISKSSSITLNFDYPLERKALISEQSGWRFYPSKFKVENINGQVEAKLNLTITYSSTCPCSAALSRQINYLGFLDKYAGQETLDAKDVGDWLISKESQKAVPHAQRSTADIELVYKKIPENFSMSVEHSRTRACQSGVRAGALNASVLERS